MRKLFNVSINEDERNTFRKAANLSGIPMSTWARQRLRYSAASELQQAGLTVPFLENADQNNPAPASTQTLPATNVH